MSARRSVSPKARDHHVLVVRRVLDEHPEGIANTALAIMFGEITGHRVSDRTIRRWRRRAAMLPVEDETEDLWA